MHAVYTQAYPQSHKHAGVRICVHLRGHTGVCIHEQAQALLLPAATMNSRLAWAMLTHTGAHTARLALPRSFCRVHSSSTQIRTTYHSRTTKGEPAPLNLTSKGACTLKPHYTTLCLYGQSYPECPGATKDTGTSERGAASDMPQRGVSAVGGMPISRFVLGPNTIVPHSLSANMALWWCVMVLFGTQ